MMTAYDQGWQAKIDGKAIRDNPFCPGKRAFQWLEGFYDCEEYLIENFGE